MIHHMTHHTIFSQCYTLRVVILTIIHYLYYAIMSHVRTLGLAVTTLCKMFMNVTIVG